MLYCKRIDVSEGIDFNKTSAAKNWIICSYSYFLSKKFLFQLSVCNGRHDVFVMSTDNNSIPILNFYGVDYLCVIVRISKKEVYKFVENTRFSGNSESL